LLQVFFVLNPSLV